MYPILLNLNLGFLQIPFHTYGLMIATGFLAGVFTVRRLAARSGVNPDLVADLSFWLLFTGFIGARILFVITRFDFFMRNPLEIFKVWEGGLVFFGGLLFATAYGFIFLKKHKIPVWNIADICIPGVVIAHAFGRLGCLAAGCCYGRPTSVPWAIKLNSDLVDAPFRGIPLHPVQLYESVALFILYFGLIYIFKRRRFEGQVFWSYFLVYPVIRSIVELFRGDSIRGFVLDGVLSTSQFISIFVFAGSLIFLLKQLKKTEDSRGKRI